MSKYLYFANSLIWLIIILFTEPLYNQSLFDESLNLIPQLQHGASNFKIKMWYLFSNVTFYASLLAPILVFLLIFQQRARAFYYVMVFGVALLVTNVMKLKYHQARPFWVSEDVQALSCSSQYGNPSGHSLAAICLLTVWLDYNQVCHQGGNGKFQALKEHVMSFYPKLVELVFLGNCCKQMIKTCHLKMVFCYQNCSDLL